MPSFKAFLEAKPVIKQIDGGYSVDGKEFIGQEHEDLVDEAKEMAYATGKRWEDVLANIRKVDEEAKSQKLLAVVYGGRFQPFHQGHYGVWLNLVKDFEKSQCWIATSNKVNFTPEDGKVSPLNFAEKKNLITELYGIPDDRVIECANPTFVPKEVLALYKGPTVLLIVVGDKDVSRYKDSKYFKPWPVKAGQPVSWKHFQEKAELVNGDAGSTSYYLVDKSRRLAGVSGTSVREDLLALQDDASGLKAEFKRVFGKWDPEVCRMLMSKLKQIKKPKPKKEKKNAKPSPEPSTSSEKSRSAGRSSEKPAP